MKSRSATGTVGGAGRQKALATCLFLAFTTPLGIAAHLIAELAGLGWHDDADVAFSARHGYLGLLAAASLAFSIFVLHAVPRGDRRARVASLVAGLPFRGRGASFTLCSFVAQFAVFAVTQIGEGCPLCSGDVVTGVFAAAVAAALGALAVLLGQRRILSLALSLIWYVPAVPYGAPFACARRAGRLRRKITRRAPFSFRYRPPPQIFAAA